MLECTVHSYRFFLCIVIFGSVLKISIHQRIYSWI